MIDLFSDSASQPSEPMREAIARAPVGDEQRGLDPTVNSLLEMVCARLDKEAALFLPTGTMCNAVAIKTLTEPGGAAMFSGVIVDQIATQDGLFTGDQLQDKLPKPSVYSSRSRLVCLEQTHNFGGGTVWPLDQLTDVCQIAQDAGMRTHLDGARRLNACVASGTPAGTFCRPFDSAWIDFSKSLGAPFGAVLAGTKEFIGSARRYKQAFGGAMRQA